MVEEVVLFIVVVDVVVDIDTTIGNHGREMGDWVVVISPRDGVVTVVYSKSTGGNGGAVVATFTIYRLRLK